MVTHDDERATDEPMLLDWAAHRRAMVVAAAASLIVLLLVYVTRTGAIRAATVTAFEVQLVLMSVVLPAAAVGGQRRLDVLCRGGAVNDAFGAGLLIVTLVTSGLTLIEALKLYLLVSVVGLACLGLFWWVREASGRGTIAAVAAGSLGVAVWAGMFRATGRWLESDTERSAAEWMIANADLHGAVASSLGLAETRTPWYGVLLVYAAIAGMLWTGPMLSTEPGGGGDAGERWPDDDDEL